MSALTRIACNGHSFSPRRNVSDMAVSISIRIEEDRYIVSRFKGGKNLSENPQEVDPSRIEAFKINQDLTVANQAAVNCVLLGLTSLISAIAAAVLGGVKKNDKWDAAAFTLGLGSALASYYFNIKCRRASFNIANKVLSASENSPKLLYKLCDYKI
jgi:hypothetical protein